jgi:hypothetical protein
MVDHGTDDPHADVLSAAQATLAAAEALVRVCSDAFRDVAEGRLRLDAAEALRLADHCEATRRDVLTMLNGLVMRGVGMVTAPPTRSVH